MTQFFNVQMNAQDLPKVQIEQSGTNATSKATAGAEESFNSVLQSSLPKESSKELQNNQKLSSQNLPEDIENNGSQTLQDSGIKPDSIDSAIAELLNQFDVESSQKAPTDSTVLNQEQLLLFQQKLSSIINNTPHVSLDKAVPLTGAEVQRSITVDQLGFAAGTKNFSELQALTDPVNNRIQQAAISEPTNIKIQQAAISDPAVLQAFKATPQTVITPQQEALLERVQAIINGGGEAGVLSIKNVTPGEANALRSQLFSSLPAQLQTITSVETTTTSVKLTSGEGFTALEDGVFAPALGNKQQLTGVRHDTTQQFYDAKTQPQNILNEAANLSGNKQGDDMGQQAGSGFNQTAPFSSTPEATNTFSLPITATTDPLATTILDASKTTVLPSGTMVQDQDVIQQLVERFRVNQRQLETKLQLKLHPVELGKMEIDLTVKEGSIRANVVAQSQHVQEILERNLAKLKSVLEQQGFNVEEITITTASDMVGEFDLFDQQLSNSESSNFLSKNNSSETQTPFILDEFEDSYIETNTGVNVKV